MKFSPIQLVRYIIPDFSCKASGDYDPGKALQATQETFTVTNAATRLPPPEGSTQHLWSVELTINQEVKPGQNFPYEFRITIIGFFSCDDGVPDKFTEEQFVRVNGSSILYGAAREVLRDMMARGPWDELHLPTVSFYDEKNEREPEKKSETPPAVV